VDNLKTLPVAKHWRSTGVSSENLQLDLGSAQSIDILGLLNHNLTSSATITINGGSSANPNGAQYTTTITYREFDAFKLLSSAQSWRYWKVIIADSTNTDGYIRIGFVMLGLATELAFHWQHGATAEDQFSTLFRRSPGGAIYAEPVYDCLKFSWEFGPITVAEMATLRTLYRSLLRTGKPVFVVPEHDVADGYFGYFIGNFSRKLEVYEYTTISFEEDGRGRIIIA